MLTKIGAMWKKSGVKGAFYSGQIEIEKLQSSGNIRILAFPVKNKKNPNQPDVEIFEADARPTDPPAEDSTIL